MNLTLRGIAFLTIVAAFAAQPVLSQIPDQFTNLQLLDKEISKDRLVGTMRDWAAGIGARCNYCHVGPDNLEGMDFASDEKPTKRTARKMLEMSRIINRQLMSDLPTVEAKGRTLHMVVSCYVCHRGESRPTNQPPR